MEDNGSHEGSPRFKFLLFVAGMSSNSSHAIENLKRIGKKYLNDDYDVQIIDISRDRHLAAEYQILGIPSLIKISPDPVRTIVGNLSDTAKVVQILDL